MEIPAELTAVFLDGMRDTWAQMMGERFDRLYEIPDPGHWPFVAFACWVWPEVAGCVRGDWPDCGTIHCGFPCAGPGLIDRLTKES